MEFAFKGVSIRPFTALLRQRCKPPRRRNNHGMAAAAADKCDDMVAMGTADFQRLVVAMRKNVRELDRKSVV